MTERGKIESLQALRAIAFLGIFFLHSGFLVSWAELGVSVFFVMSGFLMYYTYENKPPEHSLKNNLKFTLSKIKKIYPLHIITMIFAIFLTCFLLKLQGILSQRIYALLEQIVLNVTLLQSWYPNSYINVSLNGVAWYLSVSMFLYFMFPTLMRLIKKLGTKMLLLIAVLILILEVLLCVPVITKFGLGSPVYIWFMYCFPVFRLGDFWIGMSLGKIFLARQNAKATNTTIIEVLMTVLTIIFFWLLKKGYVSIYAAALHNWTTVYIPIAAVWVYLFAIKRGLITQILSNKCLIYIGNISSYLFLIHYVVTEYTKNFLIYYNIQIGGIKRQIVLIFAELLLSILISALYKKCISKKRPFILF